MAEGSRGQLNVTNLAKFVAIVYACGARSIREWSPRCDTEAYINELAEREAEDATG